MKCFICGQEIENDRAIRLFDKEVCSLCLYSIGEIAINHVLYDFYKDRIKELQRIKIQEVL